ncbi:MAG: hypothetical protein MUE46_00170 [Xanthomonadales bacterium]|jgi:uncharacterized repeat protein (TIGR02543 family)|nr:hypothetical protein [Xanthomonadales bacterium]
MSLAPLLLPLLLSGAPAGLEPIDPVIDRELRRPAAAGPARFGRSLAVIGDIDGDGHADALIADSGAEGERGIVWLYPGGDAGLPSTPLLGFRGEPAAQLGRVLAVMGDLDADGLADIGLLGWGSWPGGTERTLHLWYGRSDWSSLPAIVDAADADFRVRLPDGGSPTTPWPVVGVGDVNCDGRDDLAIASARPQTLGEGEVWLIPGSASTFASGQSSLDVLANAAGSRRYFADAGASRFGTALFALGDLDNDGCREFGIRSSSPQGLLQLHLWPGDSAVTAAVPGSAAPRTLRAPAEHGADLRAAAGDFDGDGRDELAVASIPADPALNALVAILPGGSAPSTPQIEAITSTARSIFAASLPDTALGQSLATGDFNGDRRADLVLGDPRGGECVDGSGNLQRCGRVHLLLGRTGGLPAGNRDIEEVADRVIQHSQPGTLGLGIVAAGDLDGDVAADLLVGADQGDSAFWFRGWEAEAVWVDPGFQWVWRDAAPLQVPRMGPSATTLPDGRVVVIGGIQLGDGFVTRIASAEIYDPASNTWTVLPQNSAFPRYQHGATLLADGRILVVGGELDFGGSVDSAEILDPVSGSWTTVPSPGPQLVPAMARLSDGSVLLRAADHALRFTPGQSWSPAGNHLLPRSRATLVALGNGHAVVNGGPFSTPEEYLGGQSWQPGTSWTNLQTLGLPLADGRALFITGRESRIHSSGAGWLPVQGLRQVREAFAAAPSSRGVVVAGGAHPTGAGQHGSMGDAEILTSSGWKRIPSMRLARHHHAMAALGDGVLVAGGVQLGDAGSSGALDQVEILGYEAVNPRPDVRVTIHVQTLPGQPGDPPGSRQAWTITAAHQPGATVQAWTITAAHQPGATVDATGVLLSARLPAGLRLRSSSAAAGIYRAVSGHWQIGRLPPGQQQSLTLEGTVIDASQSASYTLHAQLLAVNEGDRDPGNDSASATWTHQGTTIRVLGVLAGGSGQGRVESAPAGILCGPLTQGSCSAGYPAGTGIVLTASALPNHRFVRWSGGCSGTQAGCTLTLDADTQVVAEFAAELATLSVSVSPAQGGRVHSQPPAIDCGMGQTSCVREIPVGADLLLTATAAPDYVFLGWEGGCTGQDPTCAITMPGQALSLSARFEHRPNFPLGGRAWLDLDQDGMRDDTEPDLPGQGLARFCFWSIPPAPDDGAAHLCLPAGAASFGATLPSGTWWISMNRVDGYRLTLANTGNDDTRDSDAVDDPASGRWVIGPLTLDQPRMHEDFGLLPDFALAGLLRYRIPNGETASLEHYPVRQMPIELLRGDQVVGNLATDEDGRFRFAALSPGEYRIRIPAAPIPRRYAYLSGAQSLLPDGSVLGHLRLLSPQSPTFEEQIEFAYDGNRDGIVDELQNDVVSLRPLASAPAITLQAITEPGAPLAFTQAALRPLPPPRPLQPIWADRLVGFTVSLGAWPAHTPVHVLVSFEDGRTGSIPWKYGPSPQQPTDHYWRFLWDETSGTGYRYVIGDHYRLVFRDNQRGDFNPATGLISDPFAVIEEQLLHDAFELR